MFQVNNKDLCIYDKLIKLGKLCCIKYISNNDVFNYDYTSDITYPIDNTKEIVDNIFAELGELVAVAEVGRKRFVNSRK